MKISLLGFIPLLIQLAIEAGLDKKGNWKFNLFLVNAALAVWMIVVAAGAIWGTIGLMIMLSEYLEKTL